jgi:hypothetical protein
VLIVTLGLAAASWFGLERRALKLKPVTLRSEPQPSAPSNSTSRL